MYLSCLPLSPMRELHIEENLTNRVKWRGSSLLMIISSPQLQASVFRAFVRATRAIVWFCEVDERRFRGMIIARTNWSAYSYTLIPWATEYCVWLWNSDINDPLEFTSLVRRNGCNIATLACPIAMVGPIASVDMQLCFLCLFHDCTLPIYHTILFCFNASSQCHGIHICPLCFIHSTARSSALLYTYCFPSTIG